MTANVGVILSKHRRAEHHFQELNTIVKAFIRDQPYRIAHGFESNRTKYVYRIQYLRPIPEEINWLLGDVVHNARTCLDHLAYALVVAPTKKTGYPLLVAPPVDDQRQICEVTIDGGLPEAVRRVVLQSQPFMLKPTNPRSHPLAILKELDDMDKHRGLVPVIAATSGQAQNRVLGFVQTWVATGVLKEGEPIGEFAVTKPHSETPPYFKPIFEIRLSPNLVPSGPKDVLRLMRLILGHVERTVRLFDAFL